MLSYLWKIHHSQLGGQQGLISVFLDFPAGRNLQPQARWWCKGGISPPWPCLQATVVSRGSGGFGAPLVLPTKGSSGAHSPWNPRCWDAAPPAAIPWKAPGQNLDQLGVCIFLKVLTEQGLSPSLQTSSRGIPQPNLSCCTPDLFSAVGFSRVSSYCRRFGGFFFAHPKN